MIYVPGRLFSVNPAAVQGVENLFARNERVICLFDTSLGPMAVILVGAMIVGSMSTVWHGTVSHPAQPRKMCQWQYENQEIKLARGEEMGLFKLGSTDRKSVV